MITMGSIYGFAFLLGLLTVYISRVRISASSFDSNPSQRHCLFPVYFGMTLCLGWRTVHLLVVGSSWGRNTNPFLSEPPYFALLSAVVYLAFVYRMLWKQSNMKLTSSFLNHYCAVRTPNFSGANGTQVCFVLALFLLAVCLLSLLLPNSSGNYVLLCYGQVDEGLVKWPPYKVLTLVYLCVEYLRILLQYVACCSCALPSLFQHH